MANRNRRNLDFEAAIARGEGLDRYPGGFCAQTVNGTAYYEGLGWNQNPPDYGRPEATPGGAWQPGSNRTGE